MTLTTMDPPVAALVSVWTQQSYGDQVQAVTTRLEKECDDVAAYLVTESVPLPPPQTRAGSAHDRDSPTSRCFAGPPTSMSRRGCRAGTSITRRSRSKPRPTFGYVQNAVVRALTPGAPTLSAIVEELFPAEAISDLHAFFGAADDDDLRDRMERMVASTAAFGANKNVDTVPTSRYVYRSPFDEGRQKVTR